MLAKNAGIVGAGIAGLTVALALAKRGICCDIFEQTEVLAEVGAGLQISPNASRILRELGLLETIEAVWLEPEDIKLVSGKSLREIAAMPCGRFARSRWSAPYGVLHRATLQKILLEAVVNEPLCKLHLGGTTDVATLAGRYASTDVIIGADGVWSKSRSAVPQSALPQFSGNIAWRFTISQSDAPAFLERSNVMAFLGPSAHLVCYPIKETSAFNLVAITAGDATPHDWNLQGSGAQKAILQKRFGGWHPGLRALLEDIANPTFWPLYEVGAGRWYDKNIVLIGDAAHAMMPFAAQGAAMAIEDAYELAVLLGSRPVAEALAVFENHRVPRIARLRQRAAFNRFAYHARGPVRLGRDIVLSLRPPQSLAADMDWIYGYKPMG